MKLKIKDLGNEHWCEKHNCPKTWMISSSFCPKCEAEEKPRADFTVSPEGEITVVDWMLDPIWKDKT